MADLEVGVERGHGQPATGANGTDHAFEHGEVLAGAQHEAEAALAQRHDGVEVRVEGEAPGHRARSKVAPSGACSRARAMKRSVMSTPWQAIPRRASSWAWRPGPQPTSSTRMPGSSPRASTRYVDLLGGAHREGVAEVRRAEVVGDGLEPVVRLRGSVLRHPPSMVRAGGAGGRTTGGIVDVANSQATNGDVEPGAGATRSAAHRRDELIAAHRARRRDRGRPPRHRAGRDPRHPARAQRGAEPGVDRRAVRRHRAGLRRQRRGPRAAPSGAGHRVALPRLRLGRRGEPRRRVLVGRRGRRSTGRAPGGLRHGVARRHDRACRAGAAGCGGAALPDGPAAVGRVALAALGPGVRNRRRRAGTRAPARRPRGGAVLRRQPDRLVRRRRPPRRRAGRSAPPSSGRRGRLPALVGRPMARRQRGRATPARGAGRRRLGGRRGRAGGAAPARPLHRALRRRHDRVSGRAHPGRAGAAPRHARPGPAAPPWPPSSRLPCWRLSTS